jgi:hypothetical protein
MSSLFFIGGDRADPMPSKNERQGRSANIFFFHEGSLQGHHQSAMRFESASLLARGPLAQPFRKFSGARHLGWGLNRAGVAV